MPAAITYPIGPAVKWALRIVPPAWVLGETLLDAADDADPSLEWRHLQIVQSRGTPVGTVEDKALMTFDLLNITGGSPDASWTSTDYSVAEARFSTYLTAIAGLVHSSCAFTQYRWYKRRFSDPMLSNKRFADTGPPDRLTTITVGGTNGSNQLPYQVAASITERTPWPRHWGRWYIPSLALTIGTNGRFGPSTITTLSASAGALLNGLSDDQLPLVVPSTQADSQLSGHLLGVTEIAVDDVPDVQRRRRPKQVAARTVVPLS